MTVTVGAAKPEVDRFVWTGRTPDVWLGGADGWSHSQNAVKLRLGTADEVVVLDAPSFPWELVAGSQSDVRFMVRLPDDLDAEQIAQLLGDSPLSRLTEYDRLLEGRADVREALTERFGLPDIWIPYDAPATSASGPGATWRPVLEEYLDKDSAGLAEAQLRKPRFNQIVQAVVDEVQALSARLVAVGGDPRIRPRLVEVRVDCAARRVEEFTGNAAAVDSLPSPDAVILVLRDGGQSSSERLDLLRSAYRLLHPGGQLIVLGYVVSEEDAPANPWIGELIQDVHEATGTSVHLEELRSIHWAGEAMSRGALLRFSSLRLRGV